MGRDCGMLILSHDYGGSVLHKMLGWSGSALQP